MTRGIGQSLIEGQELEVSIESFFSTLSLTVCYGMTSFSQAAMNQSWLAWIY
jgi:uncharacterized protein YbbC (DUF1343 family)